MITEIRRYAEGYATRGLPGNPDRGPIKVLPVSGKAPAIPGGRGVLDATHDPAVVRAQFSRSNVTGPAIAIPDWAALLDIDTRHGGDRTLAALIAEHGPLPETLTTRTGRGGEWDLHLWFTRPEGRITGRHLDGCDVLAVGKYALAEPAVHPETGGVYRWARPAVPVAPMPQWLAELIVEPEPAVQVAPRSGGIPLGRFSGPSPVGEINRSVTWHDILDRYGWRCTKGGGDEDGSVWLHPAATSRCSATVRGGRLYCWSPNTPFEPSASGEPRGYSKAEALAVLDHGGDVRALVAAVRETGVLA